MPTSERESIMTEFRAASQAVISNAKCLTEGVDVPVVDMVAFLTPKRSRVDIVQATGRAMRKADGKTTGYVLVPLFVEQAKGETIEEALARTEFDEVWNVLQAMQEQDDLLAEIIREMREERARTKGFDDTRFREKVEFLGPQR
jgi:predicted helicase